MGCRRKAKCTLDKPASLGLWPIRDWHAQGQASHTSLLLGLRTCHLGTGKIFNFLNPTMSSQLCWLTRACIYWEQATWHSNTNRIASWTQMGWRQTLLWELVKQVLRKCQSLCHNQPFASSSALTSCGADPGCKSISRCTGAWLGNFQDVPQGRNIARLHQVYPALRGCAGTVGSYTDSEATCFLLHPWGAPECRELDYPSDSWKVSAHNVVLWPSAHG